VHSSVQQATNGVRACAIKYNKIAIKTTGSRTVAVEFVYMLPKANTVFITEQNVSLQSCRTY